MNCARITVLKAKTTGQWVLPQWQTNRGILYPPGINDPLRGFWVFRELLSNLAYGLIPQVHQFGSRETQGSPRGFRSHVGITGRCEPRVMG